MSGRNQNTQPMQINQMMAGGLVLVAVGAIALFSSRHLEFGTLAEIGPGLFPRVIALFIVALGGVMVILGLQQKQNGTGEALEPWAFRPIIGILGAIILFGITIRGLNWGALYIPAFGLVGAAPLAMLFSGLADPKTNWKHLAILCFVITILTTLLFRFGLGLSVPVAPWLIGY